MSAHAYARSLTTLRQELADVIILSAELDANADVEIAFKPADPGNALMALAFAVAEQRCNSRGPKRRLSPKPPPWPAALSRPGGRSEMQPGR